MAEDNAEQKSEMTAEEREKAEIAEALTQAEIDAAEGREDCRASMIKFAKSLNGYNYITISRIDKLPDSKKGERASILFNQLFMTFMIKNKDQKRGFMEVFGSGEIAYYQAFQEMPTLGDDGLYDARTIDGRVMKSIVLGHCILEGPLPGLCEDEVVKEGYCYYTENEKGQYVEFETKVGESLKEKREHAPIYFREARIPFQPLIIVKGERGADGNFQFGQIIGNPYHKFTAAESADIVKRVLASSKPKEEKKD